jgi:hypothetical protein
LYEEKDKKEREKMKKNGRLKIMMDGLFGAEYKGIKLKR